MAGVQGPVQFHPHHGANIVLGENGTVAYRKASFAHGLVFSQRSLKPGEVFLVEITQTELGWNGSLRLGLTQLDPNTFFELPLISFDLLPLGLTWLFKPSEDSHVGPPSVSNFNPQVFFTLFRFQQVSVPTVGSLLGVQYRPRTDLLADLHVFVDGVDKGVVESRIPYGQVPLYVVADVYGTTKEIRIRQVREVTSLQTACKEAIMQAVAQKAVTSLPLPKFLKDFLLYR